jgi:hypothetical protein
MTGRRAQILSQLAFTAQFDSVTSDEALANPFDKRVTLGPGFINVRPARALAPRRKAPHRRAPSRPALVRRRPLWRVPSSTRTLCSATASAAS